MSPTIRKSIKCADGFTMSVQASKFHYCLPRNDEGPHTHVEIGFPSAVAPLLMPYCDEPDDPTGTVYGYVTRGVVEAVVLKHNSVSIKEIEQLATDLLTAKGEQQHGPTRQEKRIHNQPGNWQNTADCRGAGKLQPNGGFRVVPTLLH